MTPTRIATVIAALGLAAATACGGSSPTAQPPSAAAAPADTGAVDAPPAPRVHVHQAGAEGIFANAYLVETPSGVIAVDALLRVSDARALRAELDALGKPLVAVLLTHGHPDHYNGVTELIAGADVPVIATAGVDAVIRKHDAAKEQQWRGMFGDEWPATRTFPTRIAAPGETIELAGARFTVHDLGPGESHHDSYWVLEGSPPIAFIGDVAFDGVHAYTTDAHLAAWLGHLDVLETELAGARLYPGHGDPGDVAMLAKQRAYLELYRDTVARLVGSKPALDDAGKQELTRVMKEHLGTDRLEFLIALGADPVAAALVEND